MWISLAVAARGCPPSYTDYSNSRTRGRCFPRHGQVQLSRPEAGEWRLPRRHRGVPRVVGVSNGSGLAKALDPLLCEASQYGCRCCRDGGGDALAVSLVHQSRREVGTNLPTSCSGRRVQMCRKRHKCRTSLHSSRHKSSLVSWQISHFFAYVLPQPNSRARHCAQQPGCGPPCPRQARGGHPHA